MNFKEKLPFIFKRLLKNFYYMFFDRYRYSSHQNYLLTDEKLKFTHILEGINYLRTAGNNGKDLPQTYFEFVRPLLVNGSIILFDDWYCFKPGTKHLYGEQKAVQEFLEINKDIKPLPWKTYSTFGKSFFVNIL